MRALVLKQAGQDPVLSDFDEPEAGDGQQVVKVLAAGLNPYDRFITSSPDTTTPRIIGLEAVVELENGKKAYASGVAPYGTVAEKTLIKTAGTTELPDGVDNGLAVAVGTSGLAAWLPLSWKVQLKPGESVLILGATGVQGQIAVQAAKLLGASHVVAAGRNKSVLEGLKSHGANDIAILEGDLAKAIKKAAPKQGYQVVIDSLFGEPFAAVMKSGTLGTDSRVAVIGGSAGQEVNLNLRELQGAKGATIAGYNTFFVPAEVKNAAYLKMVEHVMAGDIKVDVQAFSLDKAEDAWAAQAAGPHAKIVVTN